MKKALLFLFSILYLAGVVYLSLPSPQIPPLPNGLRSDEPGDTWQNPDQSAYFTDLDRQQVLSTYQDSFALKIGSWTVPSYRLNYRPEDTATYVRKHIDSYYLEEIIHPLRESLFVNGWNPKLSPLYAHLDEVDRDSINIVVNGKVYQSKVTIKPYYSSLLTRQLIWLLIFPLTYCTFLAMEKSIKRLYLAITT